MPVKLWEGWEKPHIKGSLGLILDVQKVISGDVYIITARVSLKAEAALHNVTTGNTKFSTTVIKQSRVIHCVQEDAGPAGAPCCCPHHMSPCPQSHNHSGMVNGIWKKLQVLCLSSRLTPLALLLSPSQISPFPVNFDHWRRHQVFSSAWNVHSKESTLFCSMCLC